MRRNCTSLVNPYFGRSPSPAFRTDSCSQLQLHLHFPSAHYQHTTTQEPSYCSLRARRRQLMVKQEDRRRLSIASTSPLLLQLPLSIKQDQNSREGLLRVTPVVIYSSLKNKKLFFRAKAMTKHAKTAQGGWPKTDNSNFSKKNTMLLNVPKKVGQGKDLLHYSMDRELDRRPRTTEIGSNRLWSIEPDRGGGMRGFEEKLRGWETGVDSDDF